MGACTNPQLAKGESIKICMELCETSLEKLLERDRQNRANGLRVLNMIDRIQLAKQLVIKFLRIYLEFL
jgi:hypothetical protein